MKKDHRAARDLHRRDGQTQATGLESELLRRAKIQQPPDRADASQLYDVAAEANLLAGLETITGDGGPIETPVQMAIDDQEDRGDEGETSL